MCNARVILTQSTTEMAKNQSSLSDKWGEGKSERRKEHNLATLKIDTKNWNISGHQECWCNQ